ALASRSRCITRWEAEAWTPTMALSLVFPPFQEPITADQVKTFARIATSDTTEDDLLTDFMIPAARQRAEAATNRQLIWASYRLTLDGFPCDGWIEVPRP